MRDEALQEAGKNLEKNIANSISSVSVSKKIIISKTNDSTGIQIIIDDGNDDDVFVKDNFMGKKESNNKNHRYTQRTKIIKRIEKTVENEETNDNEEDDYEPYYTERNRKSENFEVITKFPLNFTDIGGYDSVKKEMYQIVDLLKNHTKYSNYNIRVPKGLILEGPPGNGKTLFAKALAGEAHTGFISVSGSEFQDKYVGVGSGKVRELFNLAKNNRPCIIFIDEIDALGRKRSTDGELSTSERDSTLNELLVALDGFKNTNGVFVVGATNRVDLLDKALIRPGRIDKNIHIGSPDTKTRKRIIDIHIKGKPYDESIVLEDLIEQTNGFSGAQIENILNEAMLNALRDNRPIFSDNDVDIVVNKQMVGWQPTEHEFTDELLEKIAVHEMGHAILGMISLSHPKVKNVKINLSSPNSPGYTVFEPSTSAIYTREYLFERLTILLGGRVAEEIIYNRSVTTGAINDFEEAHSLAEKMILYYGMGSNGAIYNNYNTMSDFYKQLVDEEIQALIQNAYITAKNELLKRKDILMEGSKILQEKKVLSANNLHNLLLNVRGFSV